jgi:kynurenine formamidase
MEQMAYLDQIPKPFGFKVAAFPIKIKKGSGALVRPVAIIFD